MKKNLLIGLTIFINFCAFSQYNYYPKIEDITKLNLASFIAETRNSENDTFRVVGKEIGVFNNSCLPLKYTVFAIFATDKESLRDTFMYENGKIKSKIRYSDGKPLEKSVYGINANGRIDTTYIQAFDNLGNIRPNVVRYILYRNRFGSDSLFITQVLDKGVWKLGNQYHSFFYDGTGRITQAIYGAYYFKDSVTNVYVRTQTTNYIYTGNNLTLKIDSIAQDVSATSAKVSRITKVQYKYDNLNRLIDTRLDLWAAPSPEIIFVPVQQRRITSFNSRNQETEVFSDAWENNAWVEKSKSVVSYGSNNLDKVENNFSKQGLNWVQLSKSTTIYCRNSSPTHETNLLEVNIYPNPAQNNITIEGIDIDKTKLQVFDNIGNLIFQKNDLKFPYTLDISRYSNGLYFFKMNNGAGQSINHKIIVIN